MDRADLKQAAARARVFASTWDDPTGRVDEESQLTVADLLALADAGEREADAIPYFDLRDPEQEKAFLAAHLTGSAPKAL